MLFRGWIEKKLNKTLKNKLNQIEKIKKFGSIQYLKINLKKRTVSTSYLLKGETYPIKIEIEKFDIKRKKGNWYVILDKITSNKEWLNLMIEEFLDEDKRKIQIPNIIGQIANGYLKL